MDPWRNEKQLTLRFRQDNKPTTFKPRTTAGHTTGTPQRAVTSEEGHGMLAWLKAVASGEIIFVRCCFTLCSFVEVACEDDRAKLHAQVAA